jgi:hypothetical protein
LTAISSSPVGTDKSHLPPINEDYAGHFDMDVDWSDRADVIESMIKVGRRLTGTA